MPVASKLRALRGDRTQREVADAIGVIKSSWAMYERGEHIPRDEIKLQITKLDNKWIPAVCGLAGVALGIAALYMGVPDFPATDPMTAAAVGGASGLAATGIDQAVKQLTCNR